MIRLEDTIEIDAPASEVFAKLSEFLTDRDGYLAWHSEHVDLRWFKGEPMHEGSVLCADEYLHGRLHKLRFRVTRIVPDRLISYRPLFPLSIIATGNRFRFEPLGENRCTFIADGHLRFPLWLFRGMHEEHEGKLAASRQHMREEGKNLKRAVEGSSDEPCRDWS
ncbi:SRPBCC family protein [Candidatus Bipolaricaulota bacterium]